MNRDILLEPTLSKNRKLFFLFQNLKITHPRQAIMELLAPKFVDYILLFCTCKLYAYTILKICMLLQKLNRQHYESRLYNGNQIEDC